MSYDASYRPSAGYAEQPWPPASYPGPYPGQALPDPYPEQPYPGQALPDPYPEQPYPGQAQAGQPAYWDHPADAFDGQGTHDQATYGGQGYHEQGYPDQATYDRQGYGGWESVETWHAARPSGPLAAADSGGGTARRSRGIITGSVMGFLAAAVAIGVATLAAAFFRPQASPIIAVGEAFIDRTPSWLKNFAVQKFGEHDKTMLLLGMYVTIALLAIAIGIAARRHTAIGVTGIAVFGLFGAFVAYTRPASKVSDVIPSVIGGIAGIAALLWLAQAANDAPYGGRA